MNYLRILKFSLLVLLALGLPGVALAMVLGWNSSIFGQSPEEMGARFRLIEIIATGTAVSLSYAWFLWPINKRVLVHAAIVFLAVEAIQVVAGLLVGDSVADAFVWRAFLTDALYAAIGVLLVAGYRSARTVAAS